MRIAGGPLIGVALTLVGCTTTAVSKNDLPVHCLDRPVPGRCRAEQQGYYYLYSTDSCHAFTQGGCGGRVPFDSLEACRSTCVAAP